MKRNIIPATLLAIAIVVLGLCIKGGIDNIAFNDRDITVRGLSERIVNADRAIWATGYTLEGDDMAQLYEVMRTRNAQVIAFLKDNGITDNEITVTPPRLYDAGEYDYNGKKRINRYSLTANLTVSTDSVANVTHAINNSAELMLSGISINTGDVEYTFEGLNEIKPDMIAEATKNAREAADRFAEDSQSHVGKIKTALQGQFSIESVDETRPFLKRIRVVTTIDYYLED